MSLAMSSRESMPMLEDMVEEEKLEDELEDIDTFLVEEMVEEEELDW